ncbi:MAG: iron-sulfur cluster loop [Bacillota bacterium]
MQKKKEDHLLVTIGKKRFENPEENSVHLVEDQEANSFLNDLVNFPHAYVLACCMDRQVKAEIAWMIPIRLRKIIGDFSIETLDNISLEEYLTIFNENTLHRFNDIMAKVFYSVVKRIVRDYDGDASKIWVGNPSSAAVVYRFLQFDGVGIKIATMATNILARQFKVPFSDYYSIDISPDVHILRVLRRSGLVDKDASIDSIIYKARELCPEFPGIIDFSCWEIGRKWCRPRNPNCEECIIEKECLKNI